jgi:hypothetical protein
MCIPVGSLGVSFWQDSAFYPGRTISTLPKLALNGCTIWKDGRGRAAECVGPSPGIVQDDSLRSKKLMALSGGNNEVPQMDLRSLKWTCSISLTNPARLPTPDTFRSWVQAFFLEPCRTTFDMVDNLAQAESVRRFERQRSYRAGGQPHWSPPSDQRPSKPRPNAVLPRGRRAVRVRNPFGDDVYGPRPAIVEVEGELAGVGGVYC